MTRKLLIGLLGITLLGCTTPRNNADYYMKITTEVYKEDDYIIKKTKSYERQKIENEQIKQGKDNI